MKAMYAAFLVIAMITVAAGITLNYVNPSTATAWSSQTSVRLDPPNSR